MRNPEEWVRAARVVRSCYFPRARDWLAPPSECVGYQLAAPSSVTPRPIYPQPLAEQLEHHQKRGVELDPPRGRVMHAVVHASVIELTGG
jgi:hypothetical protein